MKDNHIKIFRKKFLKTQSRFFRLMLFLKISKLKITYKKVWNNDNDYNYSITEFNLYNPLTYIVLLFVIPLSFIVYGFNKETLTDIISTLKNND